MIVIRLILMCINMYNKTIFLTNFKLDIRMK